MIFMKKEKEVEQRTAGIRNGGFREYFTEEERKRQREHIKTTGQPFELEVQYTHTTDTTHIRVEREYLEKKMGLRELLRIIKRLSNEKGALSKQLYKYYEKMGASKMKYDVMKMYEPGESIDLRDPNDRQVYYTTVELHYGKDTFYGFLDCFEDELGRLAQKHLSRCIAILTDKGYIEVSNSKKNRYMRGYKYTYSNTYYKLTEKAEKLLREGK
jgi:hypothetical protein